MFLKCFEYNQHFVAMMNVINKARLFPPENGHKHHIIPKCWFKINGLEVDNSDKNLVLLSKEDHAKVHKLAMLCVKDTRMKRNMACACHFLGLPGQPVGEFDEEHKRKISQALSGKPKSEIHKKHLSEYRGEKHSRYGKTLPKEHCEKIKKSLTGKYFTEERKENMKKAWKKRRLRKEKHYPTSVFGKLFYEKYGKTHEDDPKLYDKLKRIFYKNGEI